MSQPENTPAPDDDAPPFVILLRFIRSRLFSGLMVALPIVITIAIIYYLYSTLRQLLIDPIANLIVRFWGSSQMKYPDDTPDWFPKYMADREFPKVTPEWFQYYVQSQQETENIIAPLLALGIVIVMLYVLGMLFQTRLHRALDWLLLKMPGVTTIYKAVSNVFKSLSQQQHADKFKRVVQVKFPHTGTQVPAFVTSSCVDANTGKTILCVYVPTTPVPTSGYMLLVPEEDVIPLSWDLNETLQAIVSGGITVPENVDYYPEGQMTNDE